MAARAIEVTAAAGQDAQHVVGLGQRPLLAGSLGQFQRPVCPHQRQV